MTARSEAFRALGVLCELPDPAHVEVAAALDLRGWQDDDGLFAVQLLPYASIYLGPEGMLGGPVTDRIAGVWRALGYDPPAEPDHLAALLGLYAALVDDEERSTDPAGRLLRHEARRAVLWEHLLTWVPVYTASVAASAAHSCHADWAALLTELLVHEAADVDPPGPPPAHLDQPPLPVPEPGEGLDAYVRALLTPVRSGVVLTRADLARCARSGGLGLRLGERAFVLRWLLEQDAAGVLAWIAREAERWASRHAAHADVLGAEAARWQARALATAATTRHIRRSLQEVLSHVL